MEHMKFGSLEPIVVRVTLGDKDYVLVEPDEATASRAEDAKMAGAKYDQDGKVVQIGSYNAGRAVMLQGCLFETAFNEHGTELLERRKPVSLAWCQALKRQISDPLYDKLTEMGSMNKPKTNQEADAKN